MHRFLQEPHRPKTLLRAGGQPYLQPVSRQNVSWARVILLLTFGFGFDHKETTETHSDLNRQNLAVKKGT
jgi:hypothetical protein